MFNQLEGVNEFCAGNVKPNFVLNLGGKTLYCYFDNSTLIIYQHSYIHANSSNIFHHKKLQK